MLEELNAVLSTGEFEDAGAVLLYSARWPDQACEILLDVRTGDVTCPRQAWLIRCAAIRATRLAPGWAEMVELVSAHPLLLPHTEARVTLAFRGHPEQPRAVVGALWEAHRATTDEWYPFGAFFNPSVPLAELVGAGGGILAEGPQSVMVAYANALRECGLSPSILGERPPLRFREGAWVPEPEGLTVLIVGESYAIGVGFEIARVGVERLDAVT
jgi:hypothetical protein